jgi:uncharacterized protein
MSQANPRPCFLPDEPFPPYSYVPGQFPHPHSDPRGHSHGLTHERPPALDARVWQTSRAYLRGVDLFNHGFYWEAHEAWEELWLACGRHGPAAMFLKALIKLAAAGVKLREGQPEGVRSHARRALALLDQFGSRQRYMGVDVCELMRFAKGLAECPPLLSAARAPTDPVFDFVLWPTKGRT